MQVYADNAATTRMSDKAVAAMTPYFQQFYGNPSSLHTVGQQAAEALADARRRVADCLGCSFKEITFTSGGSEADNQAIVSAARIGERKGKKHIISTVFEHHAILHTLKKLEKETDEGRSDLTSAAIKRQADILMENGDKAGVASLYRKSMKDYARRAEVFEALMGQYYRYVSQEPEAVLQLAKEAESSYNRYIRTKSDDYFKVKKEVAIQRKIAGYYEKGGNEKKAASLRKDAEKREKNSKKGIREEG